MSDYQAPLPAIRFALDAIVGSDRLATSGAFPDFDVDMRDTVLDEAAKLGNRPAGEVNYHEHPETLAEQPRNQLRLRAAATAVLRIGPRLFEHPRQLMMRPNIHSRPRNSPKPLPRDPAPQIGDILTAGTRIKSE